MVQTQPATVTESLHLRQAAATGARPMRNREEPHQGNHVPKGSHRMRRLGIGALLVLTTLAAGGLSPTANAAPQPAVAATADTTAPSPVPGGTGQVQHQPLSADKVHISKTKADCDKVVAAAKALRAAGKSLAGTPKTCVSGRQIPNGTTSSSRTGALSTLAAAVPSYCDAGSDPSGTWWADSRRSACQHTTFALVVTEVPSGRILGTADFHAINTMTSSTSSARWSSTTSVWVWSWTGAGFPESSRGLLYGCPGDCLGAAGSYTHPAFDEWYGSSYFDVLNMTAGTIKNPVTGRWQITMSSSKYGNSVTFDMPLASSRCDNTIGNRAPGCVFNGIPGVMGYSQSLNPAFVDHIYKAQVSGLPGRLSTSTYLKKLSNATQVAANGAKACPSSLVRPTGYSCDEYPFRSTYQGASTSGATLARSFPGCQMPDPQRTGATGWSRCFIPATQNSSAGGLLSAFYSNERILDGDLYQVGYLP